MVETPTGGAKPSARMEHAMAAVGDELYLHGGSSDSGKRGEREAGRGGMCGAAGVCVR